MKITGIVSVEGRSGHNTCTFEALNQLNASMLQNEQFYLTNALFYSSRYRDDVHASSENVGMYATFAAMHPSILYGLGMNEQDASGGTITDRGISYRWTPGDYYSTLEMTLTIAANVAPLATPIRSFGLVLNGDPSKTSNDLSASAPISVGWPSTSKLFCYYPLPDDDTLSKIAGQTLVIRWIVRFWLR